MKGWFKLLGILLAMWLFFGVFTPFWVSFSPAHQLVYQVHEENEIPTGGLYYNDLKFMTDAVTTVRDTWRFLPKGPKIDASTANATSAKSPTP